MYVSDQVKLELTPGRFSKIENLIRSLFDLCYLVADFAIVFPDHIKQNGITIFISQNCSQRSKKCNEKSLPDKLEFEIKLIGMQQ